jgi:hypothetical protein
MASCKIEKQTNGGANLDTDSFHRDLHKRAPTEAWAVIPLSTRQLIKRWPICVAEIMSLVLA